MDRTEMIGENMKRSGYLLYIMNLWEHNHEKTDDVKDYYKEVTLLFLVTILLEQVIRYYQGKPIFRMNDTISNVCHGVLMVLYKIPFKGAEVWIYSWIYANYRLITLPWDSAWTWIISWIASDFCYYWVHRMVHQVNIFWAIHETHHTPEDINFSTPMRNHIFLFPIHWLPVALAIPPSTYLLHYQITIIYQYFLHTEIIGKLPSFIEYFFATPSHHRGHHGRNRKYIDKNFGEFLIIWDRIFGTFEPEDPEEKPLYGTTSQMKSFNPLVIQTSHFKTIWRKFNEYEGIGNKMSVIFKGPGWEPGKPWTGELVDIPHPAPEIEKYDPSLPRWFAWYTYIHFLLFLNAYLQFALNIMFLSKATITAGGLFLTLSTIAFGFILDKSVYAFPVEFSRCILYFLTDRIVYKEIARFGLLPIVSMMLNRIVFSLSIVMWIVIAF